MHHASVGGHRDAVKALLRLGADLHAKDSVRWAECDAWIGVQNSWNFCLSVKSSILMFAHGIGRVVLPHYTGLF